MKKIAKILSVVLCMVMVLGLMAVTTFAAGGTATYTYNEMTASTYVTASTSHALKAGTSTVAKITYAKNSAQQFPYYHKD